MNASGRPLSIDYRPGDFTRLRIVRRMMWLLSLAVFFPGAVSLSAAEPTKTIRVVMDANYPPYVFMDEDGHPQGILIDQWHLWEQKTGIKAEIHALDWAEALRRMKAGEFDVIDSIFKTPERTAWLDFTTPYARIDVPIFFDRRISGIADYASLKGFTVAAKEGDYAVDQLRQNGITNLQLFPSYEKIVQAAAEHKVSVFVVDAPCAYYFLNKFAIQDQFRASAPVNVGMFSRAVRKGDGMLLKAVGDGFASISPEELEDIDAKWTGLPINDSHILRTIAYSAGAAIVIIFGLLGWNWMLSRQVERRTRSLQASEALLATEKNFTNAVLENAGALVVVLGPEGRICRFNHVAEQISGYRFAEVEGRALWETPILPPEEAEAVRTNAFFAVWNNAPLTKPSRYNNHWVTKTGERRLIDWFNTLLCDASGHPEFMVAIGVDITEHQQAEATLHASEERFREVVENIQEVFWVTDTDDQILYVSPAYEKIWDRPVDTFLESWRESLHKADCERVIRRAITAPKNEPRNDTYRIVRPDGGVRWIYEQTFPVKDASGKVLRTVGTAGDITERKALEERFLRSQRMDAMGSLVGGIAHDLNNIFSPVLMLSSMLKVTLPDERNRKLMAMLETNSQRGAEIIRQLLTFSRGSAGDRVTVRPAAMVEEIANIVRETFPRGIVCETWVAENVRPLLVDSTQLHQVLLNLCVNARDAMLEGGRITITAGNLDLDETEVGAYTEAQPGEYVRFDVADTGAGIPEGIMARIFEPFFTTKSLGKGTGLGLATVLGIVRGHGGFVTVSSPPGRGSVFSVCFPSAGHGASSGAVTEFGLKLIGAGKLILVVDDEDSICMATKFVLENNGFSVLTAESGEEALKLCRANGEVSLVITDIMMPGMTGIELITELRRTHPDIRVIATTGMVPEAMQHALASLGVVHILKKPCPTQNMLDAIRREMGEAA